MNRLCLIRIQLKFTIVHPCLNIRYARLSSPSDFLKLGEVGRNVELIIIRKAVVI